MKMMTWKRAVFGILAIGLLLPRAGTAQEIAWAYRAPAGGWIGITVDYTLNSLGGIVETLVVIREVVEGSPAEEAGIRVGDTITHLDGRPVSQKLFASLPETLEPGDLVRVTVTRDGRPREVLVEAGKRPQAYRVIGPDAERMVIQLEALSGNILKNLDSLRLSLSGLHLDSLPDDVTLQILRVPTVTDQEGKVGFRFQLLEPFADTLLFAPGNFVLAPDFAMPFEALIVTSRATAPLKEELAQLRKELTAVRRQELARQRELAATIQGPIAEILRRDAQIQEIRAREADLVAEEEELSARLRLVSEEEMQRQWTEGQVRSEEAMFRARRAQSEALGEAQREQDAMLDRARENYESLMGRTRSPVLLGQNIMLGAQLAPLNPQLAEYFPVDEGVFVVEVMEGTPAHDAGLQGGDIIVRVAGEEVTSLSDFRSSLGVFEGPLRIQVIRKGDRVDILIRR